MIAATGTGELHHDKRPLVLVYYTMMKAIRLGALSHDDGL